MAFITKDSLCYYTFDSFVDLPLIHAVFTRRGGTSPAPWASLNLGGTVGDNPSRVAENCRRAFKAVGRSPDSVYDVWQVHSASVVIAETPRSSFPYHKADAILTDCPEVTLLMRFADCVPILLMDPVHRVAGLVHAGWLGTVKKVVVEAVRAMQAVFRTNPCDILAALGPAIGVDHYAVGENVVRHVQEVFRSDASSLLPASGSDTKFDLCMANHLLLEYAGVHRIESAGFCTACHVEDWFSYRAEQGNTGRFGVMIGLKA